MCGVIVCLCVMYAVCGVVCGVGDSHVLCECMLGTYQPLSAHCILSKCRLTRTCPSLILSPFPVSFSQLHLHTTGVCVHVGNDGGRGHAVNLKNIAPSNSVLRDRSRLVSPSQSHWSLLSRDCSCKHAEHCGLRRQGHGTTGSRRCRAPAAAACGGVWLGLCWARHCGVRCCGRHDIHAAVESHPRRA